MSVSLQAPAAKLPCSHQAQAYPSTPSSHLQHENTWSCWTPGSFCDIASAMEIVVRTKCDLEAAAAPLML